MIDRACISLNHRCNLRCKYCHFEGKQDKTDAVRYEFKAEEAELIITNIAEYCTRNKITAFKLGIVGSGEPLLSFDVLRRVVEKAAETGSNLFRMYTITNGVGLTGEQLQFFHRNKEIIELNFSLDGDRGTHDAMRRGYEKTMAGIELYEKKFGNKPKINATVTRKSIVNAENLINYFVTNRFNRINFSKVFDINDANIEITKAEYEAFIDKCVAEGITMRQKRSDIRQTHDCVKFGRLCGVGHSNIFYTRKGIYPCGRFFGADKYKLADFDAKLDDVEKSFNTLKNADAGVCYYDAYVKRYISK